MKKLLMLTLIFTASTSFLHSADADKEKLFTSLFTAIHEGNSGLFQNLYNSARISDADKSTLKEVATNKLTQVTQANAGKIKIETKQDKTILQTAGLEQIIAFLS